MNLQHIQYFVELAHTHNYKLSAERLHITQPNLSYAIAQLEKELGVSLFDKNGRTNTLTTYGAQFLSYAENTLKTLSAGVSAVRQSASGSAEVRLGFLRYLGVEYIPSLIRAFQSKHPDAQLSFSFETGSTRLLLDGLDAGRFDYVFCSPSRDVAYSSALVEKQELVLVVPLDHPLSTLDEVSLCDTADYPYVYYAKGSSLRNVLDRTLDKLGFVPKISFEAMEDQVIAGFVAHGFGIGILPVSPLLSQLPVKVLHLKDSQLSRNVYMLWNARANRAPVIEQFEHFTITSSPKHL